MPANPALPLSHGPQGITWRRSIIVFWCIGCLRYGTYYYPSLFNQINNHHHHHHVQDALTGCIIDIIALYVMVQFLHPGSTPHPTHALPPRIPATFEHGVLASIAANIKAGKAHSDSYDHFPSKMSDTDSTLDLKMERPDPLAGSLDSFKQRWNAKVKAWTPSWPNSWIPWSKVPETFRKNWYLGFTAFGGPPVHFQIVSLDAARSITCSVHN
jgi:hypothetical protein